MRLRVTKVSDTAGKPLSAERVTQDSAIRVQLLTPLAKDASTTLTFEYEGTLESADDSPVQGLKLAYIGDDTSYLLYAGRWFPVNAYGINRFTATINVTRAGAHAVIGSGKETCGQLCVGQKAFAGSSAHKDFHLHLGQAKLSRHHRCRHFPGVQKRRGRTRPSCLLQACAPEPGRELRDDRGEGVHLLRNPLRRSAFHQAEGG